MAEIGPSLVLLGPPGAGKGTQATRIASAEGLEHVSTGDLLRRAVASGSELGLRVKAIMDGGHLVDDDIVAALVGERLSAGRPLLLDGFPRTTRQAEVLDALTASAGLPPAGVVEIRLSADEVVRRLGARRQCDACGPRPASDTTACSRCGAPVAVRPDDAEDVVRERLRVFEVQTAPLTAHYAAQGRLWPVDGSGSMDEVGRRVLEAARLARLGNARRPDPPGAQGGGPCTSSAR